MGLSYRSGCKESSCIEGSYSGFWRIMKKIANDLDPDFGFYYKNFVVDLMMGWDTKYDINGMNRVIHTSKKINDVDIPLIEFLTKLNDCDGEADWKVCKRILEVTEGDDKEIQIRYACYSKGDWKDFKDLLRLCVKYRSSMVWI